MIVAYACVSFLAFLVSCWAIVTPVRRQELAIAPMDNADMLRRLAIQYGPRSAWWMTKFWIIVLLSWPWWVVLAGVIFASIGLLEWFRSTPDA